MTAPASPAHVRAWLVIRIALIVVVVAGLTVDACVHFDLASNYRLIKTSTLSQADLFRAEGAVAIIAALWLVIRPRRYIAAIAALVAGSALLVVQGQRTRLRRARPPTDPHVGRLAASSSRARAATSCSTRTW